MGWVGGKGSVTDAGVRLVDRGPGWLGCGGGSEGARDVVGGLHVGGS